MSQIKKELTGKPLKDAADDKSLSICWKGKKPFKSVGDVKNFFKPIIVSFTNAKNVQLHLPPEAYLIVTVSSSAPNMWNGNSQYFVLLHLTEYMMSSHEMKMIHFKVDIFFISFSCHKISEETG